ncbi:MAG: Ig-like domain-containing protein [Pseudomonadota bacterium]
MRNFYFNHKFSDLSVWPLLAIMLAALIGCGSGVATSGTGATSSVGATSTARSIALAKTAASVKSDNSNTATITATVLDSNNTVLSGQTVQLLASTGQLVLASSTTNSSGQITALFSAGNLISTNRTATITATVPGTTATSSTLVLINGSTLPLTTPTTSVTAGAATALTATAKDAGGTPVANQKVRFSISTGSGTLSSPTVTTDNNGVASVNFTGTAAGTVNVLAEWLDSSNIATISTTKTYTVAAVGSAFQVNSPSSPFPVTLGATKDVVVNVPAMISNVNVNKIRFSTTLGTWQSSGSQVKTVTFATAGTYTQTFVAGVNAGNANVQIDALDTNGAVISTATLVLSLSASAASATNITLQSSATAIVPSTGTTSSTAKLFAMVTDINTNPVANAAVLFQLVNPSGGGEQISPVVVMTGDGTNGIAGQALSTFTAGTTSTNQNSQIQASVIGASGVQATTNIAVGGTAGSIAVGTSTTITSNTDNTFYLLPVTVMVSDASGHAVSGATVTVSIWPLYYYKGTRAANCAVTFVGGRYNNEDKNENLILDTLPTPEDIDGPGGIANPTAYLGTPDNKLWPPSSSAGTVPSNIVTAADGTATFNWSYLKQYANWIDVRLRATTTVAGTEAVTETIINLAPSAADAGTNPCPLPSSPFN